MTDAKRLTVRDIDATRLDYTTEDVARLFGRNVEVVRRWAREVLRAIAAGIEPDKRRPRPLPQPGTYRFAGSELLRLAGESRPVICETVAERRQRGQAAKEEALAVA